MRQLVVAFAIVLAACAPSYDQARVDPALSELREPYRAVTGDWYSDGGSVSIVVTDRDGRSGFFFISGRLGEPRRHERLFVGGVPGQSQDVREVTTPEPTKRRLAQILKAKPRRTRSEEVCLAALTGNKWYSVRAGVRGLLGHD